MEGSSSLTFLPSLVFSSMTDQAVVHNSTAGTQHISIIIIIIIVVVVCLCRSLRSSSSTLHFRVHGQGGQLSTSSRITATQIFSRLIEPRLRRKLHVRQSSSWSLLGLKAVERSSGRRSAVSSQQPAVSPYHSMASGQRSVATPYLQRNWISDGELRRVSEPSSRLNELPIGEEKPPPFSVDLPQCSYYKNRGTVGFPRLINMPCAEFAVISVPVRLNRARKSCRGRQCGTWDLGGSRDKVDPSHC